MATNRPQLTQANIINKYAKNVRLQLVILLRSPYLSGTDVINHYVSATPYIAKLVISP